MLGRLPCRPAIECRRDPGGDPPAATRLLPQTRSCIAVSPNECALTTTAVAELEHIGFRCGHRSNSDFGQDHDDVAVSEEAPCFDLG